MGQQKGVLKTWKSDKGFGFIKPDIAEGGDVFVHIRDFGNISRKPRVGDVILYQPIQGRDGRSRAGDVHIEGLVRSSAKERSKRLNQVKRPRAGSGFFSIVLALMIACAIGYFSYDHFQGRSAFDLSTSVATTSADSVIQQAFLNRRSHLQVSGTGMVIRILPDDLEGNRHQRFILRLDSGQTLLVAHNIDLAPRINSLNSGDLISFNGEYEWNDKGGVLHWTHHDPAGRHESGWLKHDGRTYE